jgi:2-hydroxychromene-2-carboxylate isomerase
MTAKVEFWFDVGSPYSWLGYVGLQQVAAARGAEVVWRPMLLGGVFKATGNRSPIEVPAKGRWAQTDMQLWAKRLGTTIRPNSHFPINTLVLMRGAKGYLMRGPEPFLRYVDAVFRAIWVDSRDMNDPGEVARVLSAAGFDAADFLAMVNDPAVKDGLKQDTEEAVARGVFGAPTFFVGDRMFWGQDRLDFVDEALAASG